MHQTHLAAQTEGNLAIALLGQGRAEEALTHFQEVLRYFESNGPEDLAAFTRNNIQECHRTLARGKESRNVSD